MHDLKQIADRMKTTLKLGYVVYADQYLSHYNSGERNIDRLAWFLASSAEYNERYDLLEQSLLELLPHLENSLNILLSLMDSNLGWDDNTNKLFTTYLNTLSDEDRKIVSKIR